MAVLMVVAGALAESKEKEGLKRGLDEYQLEMIIVAARHGARSPNHAEVPLSWSKDMPVRQLTEHGRMQQYMLGQMIRHEYSSLFNGTVLKYTECNLEQKSTTSDRVKLREQSRAATITSKV